MLMPLLVVAAPPTLPRAAHDAGSGHARPAPRVGRLFSSRARTHAPDHEPRL
jgi:hypothetical protein